MKFRCSRASSSTISSSSVDLSPEMSRFSGKTVIVTGSSNGIGRATAILFAKEGAQVTITGRDAARLEDSRQQIVQAGVNGKNVNVVVADVTSAAGQDLIVSSTLNKFGKIDILVNNAGANLADGTLFTDQSIALYEKTFKINFEAVVQLTQKTKEHLIKTRGAIVNVSSTVAGPQAVPMGPYYSAAKAALNQYTRCVAVDLVQYGVRVNAVSPGIVSSGFLGAMGMPDSAASKVEDFMASHKECIPVGHCGQPKEIGYAILFLADHKMASYIVGQILVADGGSTLISGVQAHDLQAMLFS